MENVIIGLASKGGMIGLLVLIGYKLWEYIKEKDNIIDTMRAEENATIDKLLVINSEYNEAIKALTSSMSELRIDAKEIKMILQNK